MNSKTILIISPEPWGKSFVSKHHYAYYLSQDHKVYFLNPASGSKTNPLGKVDCIVKKVQHNLKTIDYINLLPKLNNLPLSVQRSIYKQQAKQIQQATGVEKFDVVWSFDPYRFFDQQVWNTESTIYHMVDFHLNAKYEERICQSSDLKIVVSELMKKQCGAHTENSFTIGHGFAHRERKNFHPEIPGSNKIKVGYVGNINALRDPLRFYDLAKQNPTVDFIMLGPYKSSNLSVSIHSKNAELLNLDNIYLLGEVAPDMIIPYFSQCDINLMVMKGKGKDPKTNSHKLMDYFYSGNTVISDYLIDYKDQPEELIVLANSKEEFEEKFTHVVANLAKYNTSSNRQLRTNFAINSKYENKIREIWDLLEQVK